MKNMLSFGIIALFAFDLGGQILNVPSEFETIQSAIIAAETGDTIIVEPGTYVENIDFDGKDLVLASGFLLTGDTGLISQTIIDGNNFAPTITLGNGETRDAQIVGLTIIGGSNISGDTQENLYGGGIVCVGSSPVIRNNVIRDCVNKEFNYSDFGGIYCQNSEALIVHNEVLHITGFFTDMLGGIVCNSSRLFARYNRVSDITGGYVFFGGGIAADSSYLVIERNIIDSCSFDAPPFNASVKIRKSESMLTNNTLIGEVALKDSCLMNLTNNIIQLPIGSQSMPMVEMDDNSFGFGVLLYNLYPGATGENGNIDTDPMFVDRLNADYRLSAHSPCIDAGNPLSLYDPDETISDIGALYFAQVTSTSDASGTLMTRVYPNPSSSSIQTSMPLHDVRIFDFSGKVIAQFDSSTEGILDIGFLTSGMYLLTGETDESGHVAAVFVKL